MCACVYVGQRLMSAVSLKYFLPLFFFETVSHWTQSPHEFGQTSWAVSPNNPPIFNTPVLVYVHCHPWPFLRDWGSKCRSSVLHSKHLTAQPSPQHINLLPWKSSFFPGWLTYSSFFIFMPLYCINIWIPNFMIVSCSVPGHMSVSI